MTTRHVSMGSSVLLCGVALASVASAQKREDWAEYLPPGPGKTVVAQRCGVCHDLSAVVKPRKTAAEWQTVVVDMINQGAPIGVDEETLIVEYLAEAFGTQAPPLTDVNLASQEDLVKLPGITPPLAARIIAHRNANGPFSSREEVRTVAALDERAFEQVRWYLRAVGRPPAP